MHDVHPASAGQRRSPSWSTARGQALTAHRRHRPTSRPIKGDQRPTVATTHVGFHRDRAAAAPTTSLARIHRPRGAHVLGDGRGRDLRRPRAASSAPHGLSSIGHQVVSKRQGGDTPPRRRRPPGRRSSASCRIAEQAAEAGPISGVPASSIVINIFVGIFNLLPMLPLDGGHVAIAVYEAVRSPHGASRYHADVTKLHPARLRGAPAPRVHRRCPSHRILDIAHPISVCTDRRGPVLGLAT